MTSRCTEAYSPATYSGRYVKYTLRGEASEGACQPLGGFAVWIGKMPRKALWSKGVRYWLIFDESDRHVVEAHSWSVSHSRDGHRHYAVRGVRENGKSRSLLLHREIAQPPDGLDVDHANGNGLDNRKANLRVCRRGLNNANSRRKSPTSGFRGVSRYERRWQAQLSLDGRKLLHSVFDSPEEAARAYDRAAIEHFGEFAKLNFPREDYE